VKNKKNQITIDRDVLDEATSIGRELDAFDVNDNFPKEIKDALATCKDNWFKVYSYIQDLPVV
jgi:hypothetical protein